MRLRKKGRREPAGVALLLTLLILTLLVVTGLELGRAVGVEANLAGNFRDLTQAAYIAQSGVEIARALIQQDDPSFDALNEQWAQFEILAYLSRQYFPEGHFAGRTIDENAKFNPNGLVDAYGMVNAKKKNQLERLLSLLGHNPEWSDALLDWLDPDDQKRPLGAEGDYYRSQEKPYPCKNGPLDSLEEILLVKGMDPSIFWGTEERPGIRQYLTVHSDGRININTASVPVLMSLSPAVDQTMAQAVVDLRQEKPFRRPDELRALSGWEAVYPQISSEISVQSNYFSAEVQGSYREARAVVQTVIKREGKKTRLLYWRAG
jgi:general secretion pathway protein K